jgi:hypothetical protein
MLLLHQTGSVKVGEVVRYTITYTPAHDRILPSPPRLYLKVKNTSTIALRAAFIHGPYTLHVSSSPANFQANEKFENPQTYGVPEFEPNLKAGASWQSELRVPESVRKTAGSARSQEQRSTGHDETPKSISWIVEVASQVIFSNSAQVHYEVLLGRDEKSLSLGLSMAGGTSNGIPGQVSDHQQSRSAKDGHHDAQPKGVFSRAIRLKVEDTASLWNTPQLPLWSGQDEVEGEGLHEGMPTTPASQNGKADVHNEKTRKQKKVHLVVLTHGLHSNLGADMLYLKESIDEAAKQAKMDAKIRRAEARKEEANKANATETRHDRPQAKEQSAKQANDDTETDDDDEEVIVRGFAGNAVRTEKGIKYLGKRLAKFVLAMTYPDQPYKPISRSTTKSLANHMRHDPPKDEHGNPVHSHSTILKQPYRDKKLAYKITSISFIAHSLGGLVQTYAVAYIQKHSPQFFDLIKPINFVALATPFLGLSNENPLYVKFALDFGLVGRTGQDLGLTWRAPNLARTGWGALVSTLSEGAHHKAEQQDPRAKPLLRILPTGPAHIALKKFRNRTVYANVVNDGIVPLRTSCLLFLDWQGLGRVEKARRENGLVGTVAGWGWAELTGQSARATNRHIWPEEQENESVDSMDETEANTPTRHGKSTEVPQPSENEAKDADDDTRSLKLIRRSSSIDPKDQVQDSATKNNTNPFESFLDFFKQHSTKSGHTTPKQSKMYTRSQTIKANDDGKETTKNESLRPGLADNRADSTDSLAPPSTTFFEAAVDLVNPPLPPVEWLIDPSKRPRTIFHDRVYHPEDIPPPPLKRESTSSLRRRLSLRTPSSSSVKDQLSKADKPPNDPLGAPKGEVVDGSAMKVEEKIARAYHRDLSWRKVLVRLEPDAHNNLIVRRKFANAYGWPVVKHLVDTHFSDAAVARMRDEDESNQERAKSSTHPDKTGDEVHDAEPRQDRPPTADDYIRKSQELHRTNSERLESRDHITRLTESGSQCQSMHSAKPRPPPMAREDSAQWSDHDFMDSEDDSDLEPGNKLHSKTAAGGGWNWTEAIAGKGATSPRVEMEKAQRQREIDEFLSTGKDTSPVSPTATAIVGGNHSLEAPIVNESMVGLHPTLSRGSGESGDSSVSEQVARLSIKRSNESAGKGI